MGGDAGAPKEGGIMRANLTYECGCLFTLDLEPWSQRPEVGFTRVTCTGARPGRRATRRGGRGEERQAHPGPGDVRFVAAQDPEI